MAQVNDPLERINVRQHLEQINRFLLGGSGEIITAPGKISLVWTDPKYDEPRYLAVKAAGDDGILINGRRFQASEEALQQGLRTNLKEMRAWTS